MGSKVTSIISIYPFGNCVDIFGSKMSRDIDGNFCGVVRIEAGGNLISINFDDEKIMRIFCEKHNIELEDLRIKAVK